MKTVREFTYLGDWMSGERCEAAASARTKCWWVILKECSKSLWKEILPKTENGCIRELRK